MPEPGKAPHRQEDGPRLPPPRNQGAVHQAARPSSSGIAGSGQQMQSSQ